MPVRCVYYSVVALFMLQPSKAVRRPHAARDQPSLNSHRLSSVVGRLDSGPRAAGVCVRAVEGQEGL